MTPVAEIRFYDVVVFIHVAAVVVAFGATFAYPFFQGIVERVSPRSVPAMFRAMHTASTRVVIPGAVVVLATGLYLTIDGPFDFDTLFVSFGMAAIIILIGLGLTFFNSHERRAIELSERDAAAAGDREVELSDEYWAVSRRIQQVGGLASLLVLAAVFFMVVKP